MPRTKTKSKSKYSTGIFGRFSKLQILVFALIFAGIGGYLIFRSFAATNRVAVNRPAVAFMRASGNSKYWIVTDDGGIFSEGGATFYGSHGGSPLHEPITSAAARPQGDGYWLLGGDGGVFAYGNAKFFGSAPIVNSATQYRAIVSTPDGGGYWIIYYNGFIGSYGDAASTYATGINGHDSIATSLTKTNTGGFGSIPGLSSGGIAAAAASVSGHGLALMADNGAVYAYGDMPFHGGANGTGGINYSAGKRAAAIIVNSTNGYAIVAKDGAVYNYGGSAYLGGANNLPLNGLIVGASYTADNGGYWLLGQDGGIFTYGNALFQGNVNAPTIVNCWNGTQVLSTQSCPPQLQCWDKSFVTDLKLCPPQPVVRSTSSGSGSSSGGGSSGGNGGGAFTPQQEAAQLQAIAQWQKQVANNFACGSFGISTSSCGAPPTTSDIHNTQNTLAHNFPCGSFGTTDCANFFAQQPSGTADLGVAPWRR